MPSRVITKLSKQCRISGCPKVAQAGSDRMCISHARAHGIERPPCNQPGCHRRAMSGTSGSCLPHGNAAYRCGFPGCNKGKASAQLLCGEHSRNLHHQQEQVKPPLDQMILTLAALEQSPNPQPEDWKTADLEPVREDVLRKMVGAARITCKQLEDALDEYRAEEIGRAHV